MINISISDQVLGGELLIIWIARISFCLVFFLSIW